MPLDNISAHDIKAIRSRAFEIYRAAGVNVRNRVVASYPLKKKMLADRTDVPAGLVQAADELYALVVKAAKEETDDHEEAVVALLYFIHNLDCIPDKADHGLEDDLSLLEYTRDILK